VPPATLTLTNAPQMLVSPRVDLNRVPDRAQQMRDFIGGADADRTRDLLNAIQ
jgi:hypothetical protein